MHFLDLCQDDVKNATTQRSKPSGRQELVQSVLEFLNGLLEILLFPAFPGNASVSHSRVSVAACSGSGKDLGHVQK